MASYATLGDLRQRSSACGTIGGKMREWICSASGYLMMSPPKGSMFQALRKKRAANRDYEQTFDACIRVLFCGFPDDAMPSIERHVDLKGIMRTLRADGSTARESSVYAATMLVGPLLASLSDMERQATIEAFGRQDPNDPIYKGFNYMFQVVKQLQALEPEARGRWELLVSRLSSEIEGQLRGGKSTEAIHAKWMEGEVEKVAEDFRSDPKEDEG